MFLKVFFCFALIATVMLDFFFPQLLWFSLPLVVGIWVLITALAIVFLFLVSLFCYGKPLASMEGPFLRFLAYHTMDCILTLFRFRIRGENTELCPEEPCVIVCNHLSRFDPMVNFVLMKNRKLSFVSKIENIRIPIAGPIIHQIGFVPLDRENALRSLRSIHAAAKLISQQGYTVGIYPEGTRSKTGELLEFKTGAFLMAKKAKCPIAVAAIKGTNSYRGRFPFRTTDATLRFLQVIDGEEVQNSTPEELSRRCRTIIAQALNT